MSIYHNHVNAVPFFFAGIREDLSTNFAIQRQSNHDSLR